jgi:predicted amidohydrolase YtcJ
MLSHAVAVTADVDHVAVMHETVDEGCGHHLIAGGTDSLAIASFNPFVSLRWLLDGKTISGARTRGPDELPSRLDALRMYTLNSAWMTFDENERGSLEVGKLSDLAVLDHDYMTIPIHDIAKIESVLTIVGGKVVYAGSPFDQQNQENG